MRTRLGRFVLDHRVPPRRRSCEDGGLITLFLPMQMLQLLSDLQLVAVLQGSSIWTAVDAATAHVLDMCCTGQQDGGPDTAAEVAGVLTAWRAAHSPTVRGPSHGCRC